MFYPAAVFKIFGGKTWGWERSRDRDRGRGQCRDRGRGVFSFPKLFGSIFVVQFLYSYFRVTGICPSFMVEKQIKEPTEAMKALKRYLSLFFFC